MSDALTVAEVLAAEYGADYASAISHVAEVVNTYRTEHRDVLVFNLARSEDLYGYADAVEVSNYRTLIADWGTSDALITGTWSNVDTIGLYLDTEAPEGLVDVIDALANYPVLDESLMSEVEQEIIAEHWDSYGAHDTAMAVADALGLDGAADLTDAARDIIATVTFGGFLGYGYSDGYPSLIDNSAVDFGTDAVVEWFRDNRGSVVTVDRYGYSDTFDLTDANIIEPLPATK